MEQKRNNDPRLRLSESQLKEFYFQTDVYAVYGVGNELQQSRMKLILATPDFHLLDSYKSDTDLILCVKVPDLTITKYIIRRDGSYLTQKVQTLNLYNHA